MCAIRVQIITTSYATWYMADSLIYIGYKLISIFRMLFNTLCRSEIWILSTDISSFLHIQYEIFWTKTITGSTFMGYFNHCHPSTCRDKLTIFILDILMENWCSKQKSSSSIFKSLSSSSSFLLFSFQIILCNGCNRISNLLSFSVNWNFSKLSISSATFAQFCWICFCFLTKCEV